MKSITGNLVISTVVTVLVAILFAIFVLKHEEFKVTENFQLVPDDFVLPKGCDIRVDMQSGEIWARISATTSTSETSTVPKDAPEYKNITKSKFQSRLSAEVQSSIERALSNLKTDEAAWEYLEDESAAMEFGLAIFESDGFKTFRELIGDGGERALKLVSNCLQNNPLAVEKFGELKIVENELLSIMKRDRIEVEIFKKLLRILENYLKFSEVNNDGIKIKIREHVKRHLRNCNEELEERYKEVIDTLILQ